MKRSGMTLIELIVVVVLLLVVVTGIYGATGAFSQETYNGKVVRKYESVHDGETIFRIDIQREGSSNIETIECDDSVAYQIYNSATVYANLQPNKWYSMTTAGFRIPYLSMFPFVVQYTEIPGRD